MRGFLLSAGELKQIVLVNSIRQARSYASLSAAIIFRDPTSALIIKAKCRTMTFSANGAL